MLLAEQRKGVVVVAMVVGFAAYPAVAQRTLHVDADASLGGDGATWATAYVYLQDALAVAEDGDEILIAQGVYRPDQSEQGMATPGDRDATFRLITGVALRGGYRGAHGEGAPGDRDIGAFATVLSGDYLGDDVPPGDGMPPKTIWYNIEENCYHVVDASGVDDTAVLDGVTVSSGAAIGTGELSGNGAGVLNVGGSPTLVRCTIKWNSAVLRGGGMYNTAGAEPTLTDCRFERNRAGLELFSSAYGGAMYNEGSSPTVIGCLFAGNRSCGFGGAINNHACTNLTIDDCAFEGNYGMSQGGALYTEGGVGLVLSDCGFWGNGARLGGALGFADTSNAVVRGASLIMNNANIGGGGGVYVNSGNADIRFTNCLFRSNRGYNAGAVRCYDVTQGPEFVNCNFVENRSNEGPAVSLGSGPMTLTNCIVWANTPTDGQVAGDTGDLSVRYSCVEGGYTGLENTADAPRLTADGTHLCADSPCIDAGDPLGTYAGQVDVDGEPRHIGVMTDIGIDEWFDTDFNSLPDWWELRQFGVATGADALADDDADGLNVADEYARCRNPYFPPRTYYVDVAGDDESDGLSATSNGQQGPKRTVQAAIDAVHRYEGDEVILADGVYTGHGNLNLGTDGKRIVLRSANGPENCIIDCAGEGRAIGFHSRTLEAVVEGITITNGFVDYGGGGGISCGGGQVAVRNCRFLNNATADGSGGACKGCPSLVDCVFADNHAGVYSGGAVFNMEDVEIANCVFSGNSADWDGGAVAHQFGVASITNCTFVGNRADDAGAVMSQYHSHSILTNCILWDNVPEDGQVGIGWEEATNHVSYSATRTPAWSMGPGIIDEAPVFVDPGYWNDSGTPADTSDDQWIHGNYRLLPDSPCIDAGDPSAEVVPGMTDLAGHPRKIFDRVDMGAYEFGLGDPTFDGSTDVIDYGYWAECFTGPTGEAMECAYFDFDADGDVDLIDYAAFQAALTS